jgi:hypothetical protein
MEAAHLAAQLGEDVLARIALDAVQPTTVDCDNRTLHVDEIVFAQAYRLTRRGGIRKFPAPRLGAPELGSGTAGCHDSLRSTTYETTKIKKNTKTKGT